MPTNRIFAANCVAARASARSNYGGACQRRKICGSTRRGLTGVVLATTQYVPLMLAIEMQDRLATQGGAPLLPIVVPAQSAIERGERAQPPLRCIVEVRSGSILLKKSILVLMIW